MVVSLCLLKKAFGELSGEKGLSGIVWLNLRSGMLG